MMGAILQTALTIGYAALYVNYVERLALGRFAHHGSSDKTLKFCLENPAAHDLVIWFSKLSIRI